MTATIIPFPVPGSVRPASPVTPPGMADGAAAPLPPLLSPSGAPTGVASRFPAVPRWPERSSQEGVSGAASAPARGAPYLGPCRRVRGQRTTAAVPPTTAVPGLPPAAGGPDRLARALDGLNVALAQQAGTLAAWRASLAALEGAVGSLQHGLTRQAGSVQALEAQVSRLDVPAGVQGQPGPR